MGQRREPRKPVAVSVRIFGTDAVGKIFSEKVTTVDVSQKGVKLAGVRVRVNVEEIVGLTYGKNRIHFRVKWAGDPGSLKDGQMGLLNLTPDKPFWDFPLPSEALDDFRFVGKDRRQSARVKCSISAELHPAGQPMVRARVSDLSLGGCFIEMPLALPADMKLELALWLRETKVRLSGEVASTSPGFGIGVRFKNVSSVNQELLLGHFQEISRKL